MANELTDGTIREAKDDEVDELDECLHRAKKLAEGIGVEVTWEETLRILAEETDRRARRVIL